MLGASRRINSFAIGQMCLHSAMFFFIKFDIRVDKCLRQNGGSDEKVYSPHRIPFHLSFQDRSMICSLKGNAAKTLVVL